jgi:SOS response regulatory protein OraA/RecX
MNHRELRRTFLEFYALLARRGFSPDTIQRVMNAPDLEA